MHSENSTSDQETKRRTFIEEARRTQIINAAIDTLADIGYGKASLAQIAKRAGISTSLIPYHFKDKDELMHATLQQVLGQWRAYVEEQLEGGTTATERVHHYIEANLIYMGTRPRHFEAFIEIMFNMRDESGTLTYRGEEDGPDVHRLKALLAEGQKSGEFRQFDVPSMAIALRGTIDQLLGQIIQRPNISLEGYIAEVIELFDRGLMV